MDTNQDQNATGLQFQTATFNKKYDDGNKQNKYIRLENVPWNKTF